MAISTKSFGASATATVSGGVIGPSTLVSGGQGYLTSNPPVLAVASLTGSGATFSVTVDASGVVTAISTVTGGSGYPSTVELVFLDEAQENVSETTNQRTSESIDPNNLESKAVLQLDVESVPDTLLAEMNALTALAATNPTHPDNPLLKINTVAGTRISDSAIDATLGFAVTDSVDRVNNPSTTIDLEASGIGSKGVSSSVVTTTDKTYAGVEAAVAAVYASPPTPPDPNLVFTGVEAKRLTDGQLQLINQYGPFTLAWQLANEPSIFHINRGTSREIDVSGIMSNDIQTFVLPQAQAVLAPATRVPGLKLLDVKDHLASPNFRATTFEFGTSTEEDKLTMREDRDFIDPNALDSWQTIGTLNGGVVPVGGLAAVVVTASGTLYTAPVVTASIGTGATFSVTLVDGAIASIKPTAPGTGYTPATVITITDATGTGATAYAEVATVGLKLLDTEIFSVTPSTSVAINKYAETDSADRVNFRETKLTLDVSGIAGHGLDSSIVNAADATYASLETAAAAVVASPPASPDANLVFIGVEAMRLTDGKLQVVPKFGPYTTAWELANRETATIIDATGLASADKQAFIMPNATAPTLPTSTSSGKLNTVETKQITPLIKEVIFGFKQATDADRIAFEHSRNMVDPNALASQQSIAAFNGLVTPPGGIAGVTMVTNGSNFTSAPTITASVGTGATFAAKIVNGAIVEITPTAPGSGYTSATTITISGGGGTGATATALVAPPAMMLEATETVQVTPTQSLVVNRYSENDTKTKITNETEGEIGIVANANRKVVVDVVPCLATDDTLTLALAKATADQYTNVSGIPFYSVAYKRLTPTQMRYVETYKFLTFRQLDPGGHPIIKGSSSMGPRTNYYTKGGNYYVLLTSVKQVGSNYIGRVARSVGPGFPMRKIQISMMLTGITSVPDNYGLVGYCNSAAFFGMPPGTVMFLGATYEVLVNNTGGLSVRMIYDFIFHSAGHYLISVPDIIIATSSISVGANEIATTSAGHITIAGSWAAGAGQPTVDDALLLTDFTTSPWPVFTN